MTTTREATILALRWQELSDELEQIASQLEAIAIEAKKTVLLGPVKVTYNQGRRSFDYKAAVLSLIDTLLSTDDPSEEIQQLSINLDKKIELHTTPKVDHKAVALEIGLDLIPFQTTGEPTATVKLDKPKP